MFSEALPFIVNYVCALAKALCQRHPDKQLSRTQRLWLGTCLTGLLLTNNLNWADFARKGMGSCTAAALSWMFRNSDIPWNYLLEASTTYLLQRYHLVHGTLLVDDTDHRRAKTTQRIFGSHKVFDKKTGGYYNGQCLMFLVLVTDKVTLPVGVRFYRPDPARQAWEKENTRLKKAGVKAALRPKAPLPNKEYPGKAQIALALVEQFHSSQPEFRVKAVLADAAFGSTAFMDDACKKAGCRQAISQIRSNQRVVFHNREMSVKDLFVRYPGTLRSIQVRGGESKEMWVSSVRLRVKAHDAKRFVVAVKNKNEAEYRYLVATDMTWRTLDIVRCYTLRWLVETFFADWKLYEGWANLAKQPDEEGSVRGVTLSLLLDHALLTHPEQSARLETRAPALAVGSLKQATQAEAFLQFASNLIKAADPARMLEQLVEQFKTLFTLTPSSKHMNGRDLGRQEPTYSLRFRAVT